MGVTTYTDALGVTKEYREVKRPAKVGELVKVIGNKMFHYIPIGTVLPVVKNVSGVEVSDRGALFYLEESDGSDRDYVVLEPTDVVIIDGKRYQTVRGRKARLGDALIVVKPKTGGDSNVAVGTVLYCIREKRWSGDVARGISADTKFYEADHWMNGYGLHHDRYAVLQPIGVPCRTTSPGTIIHEGVTYRTVSRLAQAGDLIQITDAQDHRVKNGEIYPVIEVRGQYVFVKHPQGRNVRHGGANIYPSGYVVLEKVNPTLTTKSAPSDSERIAALETEVAHLKTEVATLKSPRPFAIVSVGPISVSVPSTPKLTREDIIRDAKRALDELKNRDGEYEVKDRYTTFYCHAEFVVDRQKRTVTCLLRGWSSKKVYARGVAHCSPDDCFNVHIGKAIALYRALSKTVPTKYLTVPQPTEPKVGDIVLGIKGIARGITGRVSAMRPPGYFDANNGLLMDTVGHGPLWAYIERVKVIDDTGDGALQCGVLR